MKSETERKWICRGVQSFKDLGKKQMLLEVKGVYILGGFHPPGFFISTSFYQPFCTNSRILAKNMGKLYTPVFKFFISIIRSKKISFQNQVPTSHPTSFHTNCDPHFHPHEHLRLPSLASTSHHLPLTDSLSNCNPHTRLAPTPC